MTIDMKSLKKQMLLDMQSKEYHSLTISSVVKNLLGILTIPHHHSPFKIKNIRSIYNLLQNQNYSFFIIDLRSRDDFETSNIRKSMNFCPRRVDKALELDLNVIVDKKADYIIENESISFEKDQSHDGKNYTSIVCGHISKMTTMAKNLYLVQGGFSAFAKKYDFLCVKKGSGLIDASLAYPFEVIPNFIFMGDIKHGSNLKQIHDLGITKIINVSKEIRNYDKQIDVIELEWDPLEDEIGVMIPPMIRFIEKCKSDDRILIFDLDGKLVAPVLAAACILYDAKKMNKKITALFAWGMLEQIKPTLKVDSNSFKSLKAYEEFLFENKKYDLDKSFSKKLDDIIDVDID